MVVTKENDETAGQWSNAAKEKLCPSQRQRDMGYKMQKQREWRKPKL
jgi:hypothetical protein